MGGREFGACDADAEAFDLLSPAVREWWVDAFGDADGDGLFTPPQRGAIPLVHEGRNALVCAPTGSGKTLAAFTAILDALFRRERAGGLDDSVYCLYVSPLKSLANDVHRNLADPLDGIRERLARRGESTEVRQAIRHGDTDETARRRMLADPPHVLNTTPETLAILLCAPKFREKLRTVEYVVVDEIHDLAASKRGTHLAVSLERLENLTASSPTRIGCSATVEPVSEVADFLVGREEPGGHARDCAVVDARFDRDLDLRVECPTDDLVGTSREAVRDGFAERLADLVADHENTLVFANSRAGAERVLRTLRERFDYDESNSACHHGSLSAERRREVEEALKRGTLDVVTTSTSLELGVDMPHVDLVVQVGSPKSAAALRQRVGRAGHGLGRTVAGRVVALDRDELVECAVMADRVRSGFVDGVSVPENAHDVAAQHVYGMAIASVRPESEVRATLRRAYPYRDFDDDDFETLFRYLTADYEGLTERNVYPKVWRDANDPPGGDHHYPDFDVGERLVGKRGRRARAIYMTNVGTIPDSFSCSVVVRGDDDAVGSLDEAFLDGLDPGDVFVLGGERFAFRYRRGSKVYVDRTDERPSVPSWFAERRPLSTDLAGEVRTFQRDLLARLDRGGRPAVRDWLRGFPLDERAVRALTDLYDRQVRYAGPGSVSTPDRLAIEEVRDREAYRRRYHVHAVYGRRVNEALARLLAHHCDGRGNSVRRAVADNGFTLSMPLNRKVDVAGVLRSLDPADARADLRDALADTDLLDRYFRIETTRSLMILARYRGREKSAARQQVESETLRSMAEGFEEFAVLEETYRELLDDRLRIGRVEALLGAIRDGEVQVVDRVVDSPTPRAFGLATLADGDAVLADDEDALLRSLYDYVTDAIDGEANAADYP